MKLSDSTERKFIETLNASDWLVETDTGWEEIKSSNKTVEYQVYEVMLENGQTLRCADTHIFFDENLNEVYARDCENVVLYTKDGPQKVLSVKETDIHENMYDLSVNSKNHRYYGDGVLSHNSITSIMWLLHYVLFNPEKVVAILANKGATAQIMLSRFTLALENVPFFLQPGTKVLNKRSIEFSNNSRIFAAATSSSSIRGDSANVIFLDEFAFVQNAEEFYKATYPVISSGKESKVIISSTANGVGNPFHKLWEGAVQGTNEFKPFTVNWWDVPGRDEEWKKQTISNTSEMQFDQEYGNSFLGTGNTLINPATLLMMRATTPISQQHNVKIYKKPVESHQYIACVDVSKGRGIDYSVVNIIDISGEPFEQVAVYKDNNISPQLLPDIVYKYVKMYNDAFVIVENNDQGSIVCNGLYHDYEYENMYVQSSVKKDGVGLYMDKKIKRIGCSNAKDLIESEKLKINDAETIYELTTFEVKGSSYEASPGNHDDIVMTLVAFGWFAHTSMFNELSDINIKQMVYAEMLKQMEEDITPFGIIDDGLEEDYEVAGGDVWRTEVNTGMF